MILTFFRRSSSVLALSCGVAALIGCSSGSALNPEAARRAAEAVAHPHATGEVMVKYRENVPLGSRAAAADGLAADTRWLRRAGRLELLELRGSSVEEALVELARDPDVEWAEPNYDAKPFGLPNDPSFNLQWHLRQIGDHPLGGPMDADISAPEAWDMAISCESTLIAVVDGAINRLHVDLNDNLWVNPSEDLDGDGTLSAADIDGVDNDGNGFVDDVVGWDFFENDNDPHLTTADAEHGTHVVGALAARAHNFIGTSGVCWRARVLPIRFMGTSAGGNIAQAISAIYYAIDMGARVINASWGTDAPSSALQTAINDAQTAGVLVVAAAGDAVQDLDVTATYPAAYTNDNVISVMGSTFNDDLYAPSNFGALSVDLAAPASNILASAAGGGESEQSGTSFAAPLVSGTAGLIWEALPGLTYQAVKDAILTGADQLVSMQGKSVSNGRLNARMALVRAGVPLPGWTSAFIGGATGEFQVPQDGDYHVTGSGTDIWGTSDQFHYIYFNVTGDMTVTARVSELDTINAWTKGGLMMRDGLAANARNALVLVTPTPANQYRLQTRTTTGGTTATAAGGTSAVPAWLRLVRSGNSFTAYQSTNGSTWTQVGTTTTIAMPSSYTVGMAICSHTGTGEAFATFDHVYLSVPPPAAPTGLAATPGNGQVSLSWSAVSGATDYTVKRGTTSGGPYTFKTLAVSTNYTDTGLTNGTPYYYVVTANGNGNTSAHSTQVTSTPNGPTSPWVGADVGAVGATGSHSYAGGVYTVNGSGADIFGNLDEFKYVYRTVTGDSTITARVTSIQNTNSWAKAAVMMRDGTAANARNVAALVSPTLGNLYRLQARTTAGSSTSSTPGGSGVIPVWLRLVRLGNNFTGYYSSDGSSWTQLGATTTIAMPSTFTVGLAVTSHNDGTLATGTFDNVSVWSTQDVGAVAAAGSFSLAGGVYTVIGSGADIFNALDEFRYVYQNITGNATIVARVSSLQNTNTWAKAAVMMRDGTASNARNVAALLSPTPSNDYRLQARTTAGASTSSTAGGNSAIPGWLRLIRAGNNFIGYYSSDGIGWTQLGSITTIAMPGTLTLGLAVTSHNDGTLTTSTLDNVLVIPPAP